MKCPACDHVLTRIQAGSLEVDVCQNGCGGIWFDVFELQQVDDPGETLGESLLHVVRNDQIRLDPSHRRECPNCQQIKLKRRRFSPKINVEVDECPACGGFWLDAGELELIRLEKGRLEMAARQAASLSPAMIRALYQMKTSDRNDA